MIVEFIHYPATNSVQVTWADTSNPESPINTKRQHYSQDQKDLFITDSGIEGQPYLDEWNTHDMIVPTAVERLASKKSELAALKSMYDSDVAGLKDAWVSASFTDGTGESERIADIKAELVEVDTQYAIDVAAIRVKYL